MAAVTVRQKAPYFELADMDNKKYGLEEALRRGPVLVAFFKVECPTCQFTFPFIERLYQQFRAQGIQVWGIAQDDIHDRRHFAKESGVSFPLLIDDYPYKVSRAYSLEYVPILVLIAADGRVKLANGGFARADLVEIQKALAKHFSVAPLPFFRPATGFLNSSRVKGQRARLGPSRENRS